MSLELCLLLLYLEGDVDEEKSEKMEEDNGNNSEHGEEEREKESKTSEDDPPTSEEKGDTEMKEDCPEEITKETREPDLFSLSVVNAYGSQEVRKLEDGKTYSMTSKLPTVCVHVCVQSCVHVPEKLLNRQVGHYCTVLVVGGGALVHH